MAIFLFLGGRPRFLIVATVASELEEVWFTELDMLFAA